ncbi:MAG: glycosyltransferase [Desulfobacterales bacterium]|nr:glycosyltransferase [Desulfobacterales bacterium]MDD4072985.1 glycosyltransferase [Desulfobacterales bacterium]MDD4392863.1 glycosyltransferase [Desulfobacterales bacterium]
MHITRTDFPTDYHSCPLKRLETFFHLIDSGHIFNSVSPDSFHQLRAAVADALVQSLVWHRPTLETSRGLLWPYESLRERAPFFEQQAESKSPFIRNQAKLFLTLLPFPGQWHRIITAENELIKNPEFQAFISTEQHNIEAKIRQKHQKRFKLRHFCQILKKPRLPHEKGILRIFSLPYLFTDQNFLKQLCRYYFLYIEPPMGIVFRHAWWRHFTAQSDPCLFGAGSDEDARFLESQENVLTTRLAHGDFLENDICPAAGGGEKKFDIVFNATFDDLPRKRHLLMLSLLKHPLLNAASALFIGRGEPAAVDLFREKVRQEGLEGRITVLDNLRRQDVTAYLTRCRMGVHLSLYENACRCIYEFFRADLPCVISSSMAGINLKIFTPQTGLAVTDKNLPEAIGYVLCHPDQFSPRNWFMTRSGTRNSTYRLNRQLKTIYTDFGYRWTEDIVALGSSGANRYIHPSDYRRFGEQFKQLHDLFSAHCPLSVLINPD